MGGFDVGSVVAHVTADIGDFKAKMNEAQGAANGFKEGLGKVGGFLGDVANQSQILAGIVGGGLVYGLKKSIDAYNESERGLKQTEAVLKSTGEIAGVTSDHITNLAQSLQKLTPISDESTRSAENMLLTFTNIGKDVFDQTTKATLDMATAMNGGLTPSAEQLRNEAILLGKALQDPDAGLGALHRVGVNVDELKKQFTASMSVQEKQKLILHELGTEFGGSAAAAAETYAGKIEMMKNKLNDFQEKIGETILRALNPLLEKLADFVNSAQFNKFVDSAVAAFNNFIKALKPVGDWIAANQQLVLTFLTGLGVALGVLVVIGTITLLINALLNPLTLVVLAIAALYTAWQTNFLGLRDITDSVVKEILNFWNNYLIPLFNSFIAFWKPYWPTISKILVDTWNYIVAEVKFAWDLFYNIIKVGIDLLTGNWKKAWEDIKNLLKVAWDDLMGILGNGINLIKDWGGTLIKTLTQPFVDAWNTISGLINKIKDGLDFTKRHSPSVVDIVKNGVEQVNRAMSDLDMAVNIKPSIMNGFSASNIASTMMNSISVDMDGAIISDSLGAQRMGEMLGDSIIKKLQTQVRF